jgi:hypothetical protein
MSRIECPSEAWDRHVTQSEEGCEVCHEHIDKCDCPECPKCGSVGDAACYEQHGLEVAHDSIGSLCDWIGIAPIDQCLRAIEKHNTEHVWLVMRNGERIYYHDYQKLKTLKPWQRLAKVGVGGIAWGCSDWEYGEEVVAGNGWSALSQARDNFQDALKEHRALMDAEEEA